MAITRKMYLFVAALFVCLLSPALTEAQVVCGGCVDAYGRGELPDGSEYIGWGHRFPNGGDGCGDIPGGGNPHGHDHCSRCGGTSTCHSHWEMGICHVLCGPGGFAAASAIEEALTTGDVVLAAAALRREWEGVSVEFTPEGGRVDLILACDPNRTFRSIPVLPSVRQRLQTELVTNSTVAAEAEAPVP